jgi:hypothetical protein
MSEKKPKSLEPNYDVAGSVHLTTLNQWITANKPEYEPKYNSFNEYKQNNKLSAEKAYNKLRRAVDWFIHEKKPTKGNTPLLSTYASKRKIPSTPLRSVSPKPIFENVQNEDFSINQIINFKSFRNWGIIAI